MGIERLAQGAPAVPFHSCSSPSASMWVRLQIFQPQLWATPADGEKSFPHWALSRLQTHNLVMLFCFKPFSYRLVCYRATASATWAQVTHRVSENSSICCHRASEHQSQVVNPGFLHTEAGAFFILLYGPLCFISAADSWYLISTLWCLPQCSLNISRTDFCWC